MNVRICLAAVMLFALVLGGCQQSVKTVNEQAGVGTSQLQAAPPEDKPVPAKEKPPLNEYKTSWQEGCSVEQAFAAAAQVLEDLGLRQGTNQTRTVQTRDPQTGRTITRTVPVSDRYGAADALSAFLETTSTGQINFKIWILFVPPESSDIAVTAISTSQPEHVLKKQSDYLRQRISEKIQQPLLSEEPLPYPQTMTYESSPEEVYRILSQWADRKAFKRENAGEVDQYYRTLSCSSASGIRFQFGMRLVDVNKTRLDIKIYNHEGKDEFTMILRELIEALDSVDTQPQAAKESQPYPDEWILNHAIDKIASTLNGWIDEMGFSDKKMSGDQFLRSISCKTASQIRFTFKMNLIDAEQTKLRVWIYDYTQRENLPKEDLSMILKSLDEVLKGLQAEKIEQPGAAA